MSVLAPAVALVVALGCIAWMASRLSKMHEHAAILAGCIAELIGEDDPARREMLAATARIDCIENGTWRGE